MIRIVSAGLLTTVQDLGRPGYADIGVSASGAADALSLRAGNLLVGNPPHAAALEMTMTGGAFEFGCDALAVFTGAVPVWEPVKVRAGDVLRCPPLAAGARAYLCVRGGIDAPRIMGSASAHVTTGLGGRALRRMDELRIGIPTGPEPPLRSVTPPARRAVLRVTPGPQSDWFGNEFYAVQYRVSEHSDRMGVRLEGPEVPAPERQLITEGVPLGAVQIPPGGQPIILFVEHQTTGGYPKIANVITADLHTVGQLRPRDPVSFERVDFDTALPALREQEKWLAELV
jgi:antagonist of KipI